MPLGQVWGLCEPVLENVWIGSCLLTSSGGLFGDAQSSDFVKDVLKNYDFGDIPGNGCKRRLERASTRVAWSGVDFFTNQNLGTSLI